MPRLGPIATAPNSLSTDFLKASRPAFPLCRYCYEEMVLAGEGDSYWTFGCDRCKVGHVFSKPRSTEAARYRAAMDRRAELERLKRSHNARKRYFILGGNR